MTTSPIPSLTFPVPRRNEGAVSTAESSSSVVVSSPSSESTSITTSAFRGTRYHHEHISISQQSTILAHRIQRQCKTVQEAMELMNNNTKKKKKTSVNHPSTQVDTTSSLDWEEAWHAVLQLCGKHKDPTTAVTVVQKIIPQSDRCRTLAITICGRCGRIQDALSLLRDNNTGVVVVPTVTTPGPYNAAIAACGTNRAWEDALHIVQTEMPRNMISTLTCNAVLTALAKSQRGSEAVQFLQQGFDDLDVTRDRTSYHHTLSALLGAGELDRAISLVLRDMTEEAHQRQQNNNHDSNAAVIISPNLETYDRLVAAIVGRRKHNTQTEDGATKIYYEDVLSQIQQTIHKFKQSADMDTEKTNQKGKKRNLSAALSSDDITSQEPASKRIKSKVPHKWDFQKWVLPKTGKGKTACWELGTFQMEDKQVIVGLHPNRNPAKNGIQLWFFNPDSDNTAAATTTTDGKQRRQLHKRHKIGFLLMINAASVQQQENNSDNNSHHSNIKAGMSQLLGLKVTDQDRRQGWAKIFIAIWLQCCLDANLTPCTGKMNKPLLCLVLQHTFAFQPSVAEYRGVAAKLLPSATSGEVVRLTPASSAVKNLSGALSPRDLQEQKIQLLTSSEADGEKGRLIEVGGVFVAPSCLLDLQKSIHQVLRDGWALQPGIEKSSCESEHRPRSQAVLEKASEAGTVSISRLFLGV